jgi:hypothetical protein
MGHSHIQPRSTLDLADSHGAVQITGLLIDGGVTLRCEVSAGEVAGELSAISRLGPGEQRLPLPPGYPVTVAEVRGEKTRVIDVAGQAEIKVRVRGDRVRIDVRLGAAALLADGFPRTAGRWIDVASWWLFGATPGLDGAVALGWEVRQLPISVDFHGLPIKPSDAQLFAGARQSSATFEHGEVRTLYVGGKRAPVRWVLYCKSAEILARRGGDRAFYQAVWSSSPNYDPTAEITRAELRLQGEGLVFVDTDTGEVIDLRDPAALADCATLAAVWASAADRRRLVIGGRSRNRRGETDPRWTAIQAAARCPAPKLRQARGLRVAACEVTQMARHERALRALHLAAASDGMTLPDGSTVGEYAAAIAQLEPNVNAAAAARADADSRRNAQQWGEGPQRAARMLRERGLNAPTRAVEPPKSRPTLALIAGGGPAPVPTRASNSTPNGGERLAEREQESVAAAMTPKKGPEP